MKNNKPDIALIRRYLNGELDAPAMYKLERQAQEDPLLMDMIQGMERGNQEVDEVNLADIHRLISKRVNEGKTGKTISWKTWAVAASLVFAFSFGTFWMLRKPDPVLLARQSVEQIKADQPKIEKAGPARVAEAPAAAATAPAASPIPALKKPELAKLRVKAPSPAVTTVREAETAAQPAAIASVVSGHDSIRNFDPRDLNDAVVVGYGVSKKAITADAERNDALNEIVTVARNNREGTSNKKAAPVTGWAAYKAYLRENAISKDEKGGKVTLAFVINAMGTPDHIRIVKGINNDIDQQAVQLIRNGPKWTQGKDSQVKEITLKVKFHDPVKRP